MRILFHPFAEKELEISADWYKERSLKQEKRFINNIFKTIDRININPSSYRKISGEKRTAKVKSFPFSIIYIVDLETIFIVSVFHHSRSPKTWKER